MDKSCQFCLQASRFKPRCAHAIPRFPRDACPDAKPARRTPPSEITWTEYSATTFKHGRPVKNTAAQKPLRLSTFPQPNILKIKEKYSERLSLRMEHQTRTDTDKRKERERLVQGFSIPSDQDQKQNKKYIFRETKTYTLRNNASKPNNPKLGRKRIGPRNVAEMPNSNS